MPAPIRNASTQEDRDHRAGEVNTPPEGFNPLRDLPAGFMEFLLPLHARFTPRQKMLVEVRTAKLFAAHSGELPRYRSPSDATTKPWRIALPEWCVDQRNQMTGPADDAELCVKMINSGAPGVMLDLEDSTANFWANEERGVKNILAALRGTLTYEDKKRGRTVGVQPNKSVILLRPRGLHLHQGGIARGELLSASLFDVARIAFETNPQELRHPLSFYIPKSESAEEALWWRDLFQAIAQAKGWPHDYIKCMALVESHPLAFEMEEFAYELREHILGLNLGRWDYMASLIHFNLNDPGWVLPDRNTIPHNVPFFQNLREHIPEICHKHGLLAIGGMTALFPSREDADLNARALAVLAADKKNEATSLMDGAWTGHPDQNEVAVAQFPFPNQMARRPANPEASPDLRPRPEGVGKRTLAGTRAAVRTVIRYRNGVLNGKGASLLDGYMEDLATDRIYRLMIAQRMLHRTEVEATGDDGRATEHSAEAHSPEMITALFDEELEKILQEFAAGKLKDAGTPETFRAARRRSEEMIVRGQFNPV
jgi:malate synthase